MKNLVFVIFAVALVSLIAYMYVCKCVFTPVSDKKSVVDTPVVYQIDDSDFIPTAAFVDEPLSGTSLTQVEQDGLLLMREEEKLARDVYTTLGDRWGMRIFSTIARSEQTHTDAVKDLLVAYGIPDPVSTDEIGVFTDPGLQSLYDDLVAQGQISLLDALIVGATVEDLDIYDLEQLMGRTDEEAIILTYRNLQKGSRNHLRAFHRQIEQQGGSYVPQYISQETFDSIIGSAQERGMIK